MSYENETFDKAVRDAGIQGQDHQGNKAEKVFSEYYHNQWPKWEREQDGYQGILSKARQWWVDNRHKYS